MIALPFLPRSGRRLRLDATIGSMRQWCPAVRPLLPDEVPDEIVEGLTAWLYVELAEDVFGVGFARAVREGLVDRAGEAGPALDDLIDRVATQRRAFLAAARESGDEEEFAAAVRSALRAMRGAAGATQDDPETIRRLFPRFEDAARRLRAHLDGIRKQSRYVMKRS